MIELVPCVLSSFLLTRDAVCSECGIAPFARQACGNATTTERCCIVKYKCCWEKNGIPQCYSRSQYRRPATLLQGRIQGVTGVTSHLLPVKEKFYYKEYHISGYNASH